MIMDPILHLYVYELQLENSSSHGNLLRTARLLAGTLGSGEVRTL